ncbi:MAG: cytidylate kinase-like family protein [Chloroflexi bacterium]|nr:cytidylate kinase-like family protein [Chloroflexota bacterium]
MVVITISRQLGSGGGDVGRRLAEKLGIPFVDDEIVSRAANLAGVSQDALSDADERRPTLLSHIADLLARYPTAAELGVPAVDIEPSLTQDTYRHLIEDVIKDIASKGSAVIVGRGSQMILRGKPDALHVHVYAPFETRVKRLMERDAIGRAEAEKKARESDRDRSGYIKGFYRSDWQNPDLYALMINTGRLDVETSVDLIIAATRATVGNI